MSDMELSQDGKYIYVRIPGAVIKLDAETMQEISRHVILDEATVLLNRLSDLKNRALEKRTC